MFSVCIASELQEGYDMSTKILVVDDSPLVRKMVGKTIQLSHLENPDVYEAGNGREALDILDSDHMDLVISDIHMPQMGGEELIAAIRKSTKYADLPVMILSSEGSEAMVKKLKAQGIKLFVQKPFTPESLRDAIESFDFLV